MPYLELPERGLSAFYVLNPTEPVIYTSLEMAGVEPQSRPFDPTKPLIVLLHGGSFSTSSFSAQFSDSRLSTVYNLLGIDGRLHGRTRGVEREELSCEVLGEDVVAMLDALGYMKYSLFGESSWGCLTAIWVALKRPEKTDCLMLSSPGAVEGWKGKELDDMDYRMDLWCTNKNGRGDKSGIVPEEAVKAVVEYYLGTEDRYHARQEEYRTALHLRYGAGTPEYEFRLMSAVLNKGRDISDELLATITCSVLLLQGEADTILSPIEATREWQKLFVGVPGGADLRIIMGGPHILSFSESSILNRMLLSFVTRSVEEATVWPRKNSAFGFRQDEIAV